MTKEAPCIPPKPEWVVGLSVQRGGIVEQRMFNVRGDDEKDAIRAARTYEPGAAVRLVREA